jgi:hypothetical protein
MAGAVVHKSGEAKCLSTRLALTLNACTEAPMTSNQATRIPPGFEPLSIEGALQISVGTWVFIRGRGNAFPEPARIEAKWTKNMKAYPRTGVRLQVNGGIYPASKIPLRLLVKTRQEPI